MSEALQQYQARCQARVDAALQALLQAPLGELERLYAAMRYSVVNGGKRVRPLLVYAACEALGVDRTTVRYVSRRPDDAEARTRIRELAGQRRRFGYRRLHWLLCREGWTMNHKKFRGLYRGGPPRGPGGRGGVGGGFPFPRAWPDGEKWGGGWGLD